MYLPHAAHHVPSPPLPPSNLPPARSSVVNDEGGEYERKYCASREPNYV